MGYKVKRILIHPGGVEKQVYPKTRNPGANTIAYYPLNSANTVNDLSGNNRNLTNNGNTTFGTYQGVSCAYFNGGNSDLTYNNFYNLSQGDYTVNFWAYKLSQVSSSDFYVYCIGDFNSDGRTSLVEYDNNRLRFAFWFDDLDANVNPQGVWTNICAKFTKSGGLQSLYVNGVLNNSRTTTYTHSLGALKLYVGHNPASGNYYWKGYLSNLIFENKARTAEDVSDYYNLTKSNYGIS